MFLIVFLRSERYLSVLCNLNVPGFLQPSPILGSQMQSEKCYKRLLNVILSAVSAHSGSNNPFAQQVALFNKALVGLKVLVLQWSHHSFWKMCLISHTRLKWHCLHSVFLVPMALLGAALFQNIICFTLIDPACQTEYFYFCLFFFFLQL